ncbi:MAG: response regulator transcription factor [Bacteroidales bacterium]|nr:response regulator transcription factor [Bacteroidales bacterium]
MKMNCLIIDDEPLAQDVIESYIEKIPYLKLIKKCKNAFEASAAIQEFHIDLLFLDIQMPDISGINFLGSLPVKPYVIFTTAYSQYAIDGFNLDAIDYLLKPIAPERFLKAVTKAKELYDLKNTSEIKSDKNFIFVKSEYQSVKIIFDSILYVEGLKDYVKIYTTGGLVMTLMTMKGIEEKLPSNKFIRVHRSFIVSINAIEKIDRNRIIIKDKRIPIGDGYKDAFQKLVE